MRDSKSVIYPPSLYRLMIDPRELPTGTGVYIFRDEGGRPLYVGKARNIRNRVSQHLKSSDMKERRLCSRASSVECILTRGEMEAALLEERLIKEMTPPFNVELKDDKSYPYLLLTTHQRFPGLFLVRGFKGRRGKLFGPYSGVKDLRVALRYLRALFPVRNCWVLRRRNKPCMEAHLGRCTAPCTGKADEEEYSKNVKDLERFLSGDTAGVLKELREKMRRASEEEKFELAAYYRDVIRGIERISEGASITAPVKDFDLVEASEGGEAVYLLKVRGGRVAGAEPFFLNREGVEGCLAVETFLEEYYSRVSGMPPLILVSHLPEGAEELGRSLSAMLKREVRIKSVDKRFREVRALAMRNLRAALEARERRLPSRVAERGLKELMEVLSLPSPPLRIEGVDISHIRGLDTVGSLVVFLDGRPARSFYRRYLIKESRGINDPAAVEEVVRRRLGRVVREGEGPPDLLLVDGGIGQLTAAVRARESMGLKGPPVVALAKREEIIYTERGEKLLLPRSSPGLLLLEAVRDEAHRFAVSHLRRRRGKLKSLLQEVKGIGEVRAKRLLEEFPSLAELGEASVEEISIRAALPREVASRLKTYLEDLEGRRGDSGSK